jgi:hypothetical protein
MLLGGLRQGVTLHELDPFEQPDGNRAGVGGAEDCPHPRDWRVYLGQMGTAAFFRCVSCGGVVIEW